MLQQPADFPHNGSQAFLAGTADPVTIIRRNADGSALVRRDPKPHQRRNRDASGNTTVPFADLHETEAAAMAPATKRRRKKGAK
ncbi:hypothetical protein K3172_13075 [Qipengyuania sp. 6B39]|uniref:hypothetical protein n=1 Tax=Qipengyuania proteolytica TaxID=2867239 RepID=UPI001C8A45B2|nr:hypothetical protein [Qipengyuania proteolytica]MBX7496792.1 hypothetical protein [Qipengyuania proteolytica]